MVPAKRIVPFLALLLAAQPAQAEVLDNALVIELVRAGLGDEAVVAKIQTSEPAFDTSTSAIIALSQAGVSSDVIAAMITAGRAEEVQAAQALSLDSPDPMVPHYAGVYMLADWLAEPKMQAIDATTSNQTRTGNFLGYALTGGIASMSFKTSVPNREARVFTQQTRPRFYFYFDSASASLSNGARDTFWGAGSVTSPAEFSLIEFDVKRDSREAKVGRFNITGARAGVMPEDQIAFSYNLISPGVYEVTPEQDMEPGEYGFIYSAATGGGSGPGGMGMGAMTSRIFDFSIRAAGE